jgi:hypothetical protein
MIRPITLLCALMALGSSFYLYHAKHEVEQMDKQMADIAKQTAAIRAESRHLMDQWIGLGEPDKLRKYSDEFLGLKAVGPTQFTRMAELAARLPPPGMAEPAGQTDMADQSTDEDDDDTKVAGADEMPVPPVPPDMIAAASAEVPEAPAKPPVIAAVAPALVPVPSPVRPVADASKSPDAAQMAHKLMAAKPAPNLTAGQAAPVRTADGQPKPAAPSQTAAAPTPAPRVAALPAPVPVPAAQPAQSRVAQAPAAQAPVAQPHMTQTAVTAAPGAPTPVAAQRVAQTPAPARPAAQPQAPVQAAVQTQAPAWQPQAAPVRQGSLLGMSRGGPPAPVPMPTPVSATWQGR